MITGINTQKFNKQILIKYLFILLGFFCSVSIFISDVLIFGIIILWLAEGNWIKKWSSIKSCNFSVAIIFFVSFYLLGLVWGDWNENSAKWIREQLLLIIVPIIISLSLDKKIIQKTLKAFLAGMLLNSIVAIGAYLELWHINYHHYPNENVAVGFLDHFDHSVFLAFSTMIIITQFIKIKKYKKLVMYSIVMILFLISLFLSHGRAGQYVFLIALTSFIFIKFFKSPKKLIISASIFAFSLTIINLSFSTFNNRLYQGIQESTAFFNLLKFSSTNTSEVTVTDTAIGDRLTYLINYAQIIKDNFWIGCGTGRSMIEYELLERKIFPNLPARPPHNNYVFILCEIGAIGLIIWLNIFIQLFISMYKKDRSVSGTNFVKFLLPISFLLICLTDEYLVRHNSTLFFCLFATLLCMRKDISTNDFQI